MTPEARKYKDSTPHLRVGDSAFEDWFQARSFGAPSLKQACRDSYAAGMGDPLVVALDCLLPVASAAEIDKARASVDIFENIKIDNDARAARYPGGVWVQAWLRVEDDEWTT